MRKAAEPLDDVEIAPGIAGVVRPRAVGIPRAGSGLPARGREIYMANGCIYCHSQQIRPEGFGTDIDRGWGPRRTSGA